MADEFTKAALYGIKTFNKKVKEKIGMMKLIELLNEYEIEREEKIDLFNDKEKPLWEWYKDCTGDFSFEPIDSKIFNGEAFSGDTANSVIISKSYGFIEWLVEQDKIDRDKKEIEKSDYNIEFTGALTMDKKSDLDIMVDTLLMLLSISDEPIDLLISLLKDGK